MGEIPGLKTKSKTWAKIQCRLFAAILTIITLMIDLPSVEASPKSRTILNEKILPNLPPPWLH